MIANGGHSGLFPHSSGQAFGDAHTRSLSNALLFCDLRLLKDETGVCLPDINLGVGTDISYYFPDNATTKTINGVPETGWFTVDYTYDDTYYFNCKSRLLALLQDYFSLLKGVAFFGSDPDEYPSK